MIVILSVLVAFLFALVLLLLVHMSRAEKSINQLSGYIDHQIKIASGNTRDVLNRFDNRIIEIKDFVGLPYRMVVESATAATNSGLNGKTDMLFKQLHDLAAKVGYRWPANTHKTWEKVPKH